MTSHKPHSDFKLKHHIDLSDNITQASHHDIAMSSHSSHTCGMRLHANAKWRGFLFCSQLVTECQCPRLTLVTSVRGHSVVTAWCLTVWSPCDINVISQWWHHNVRCMWHHWDNVMTSRVDWSCQYRVFEYRRIPVCQLKHAAQVNSHTHSIHSSSETHANLLFGGKTLIISLPCLRQFKWVNLEP